MFPAAERSCECAAMTSGSIQILVNLQDNAGQGIDVIFIFDTVMEELHLVDQASILTINLCYS